MTKKNTVPNIEAKASDGKAILTPRQWLERFRQSTKREHKIDIAPLLRGEDIAEWSGKQQLYPGSRTRSTVPNITRRAQNGTG